MIYSADQPLPDIIDYGLKVVFIGFNPGLRSAQLGHHYAGRSNRFWSFLHKSGLTPELIPAEEDQRLIDYGYGSINIIDRPSKGAADLSKEEFLEGRRMLQKKLALYQPKVACYMGVGVYREFAQIKKVIRGLQQQSMVSGVLDFVISSPSGLNRTPIPEQLKRYQELKDLLDKLNE